MKFIRIGAIKPCKQEHYSDPVPEIWPSSPPCRNGFFAFPAGYADGFYFPVSRPPEAPYSPLQYFRDENGNKMTRADFYHWESSDEYSSGFKLRENSRKLLEKRRIKEHDIHWFERPSYVMYFPDSRKDLTFAGLNTDHEDCSCLNQPLEFLLTTDGKKIPAREFFNYCFYGKKFPANYRGNYQPPVPGEDFEPDTPLFCDPCSIKINSLLSMRNVKPDQLCIWPVYAMFENEYATTLKKYKIFEYNGCLWHHLGQFLKRSEILSQFADTWFYTDMQSYHKALKKSNGVTYWRKMKYQQQMGRIGYYGAYEGNAIANLSEMYEVFFDTKIH